MGAGIAEVFARNGYRRDRRRGERRRARARTPAPGALHRPRGEAREDHRGGAGRAARPDHLHHVAEGPRRGRPRGRGRRGVARDRRSRSSGRSTAIVVPGRDPGHQHLLAVASPRSPRPTPSPGRVIGVHFFNPAPVQNLVEIVRTVVTEPDVLADVQALVEKLGKNPVVCGDKAGFIANTLLFGYLNHAVAMYEGKYAIREDIDAAMRFGCGYPMGPLALLDLIGLDTAYEILDTMYRQGRDRLHAPGPDPQADASPRACSAASPGAASTPTRRRQLRSSSPDALTPSADDQPQLRHDIKLVGVVGTGTMATGIVEVFAKARLRRALRRPPPGQGRRRRRATIEKSLDKADPARPATEERRRPRCWAGCTGTTSLDDLKDVDIVVEAIAEDLHIKTTLFENLDEICKHGAILATTTSSLPIIAMARATAPPQDVIGMHFFNPATIMKLVEVVSTVATDEDVTETVLALCDEGRQGRGLVRRPGRLHRQRAAVPLPQRRGEDAGGALRHRRRHRHRDEAGLRAADGPLRAPRRGRQRRLARDPAGALPRVPRARASRPRRCWSTWSPRATSAARPSAGSATTALADARGRAGLITITARRDRELMSSLR